jgi:hypothetical protein
MRGRAPGTCDIIRGALLAALPSSSTLVLVCGTASAVRGRIPSKLNLRDRVHGGLIAYEPGLVRPGEHPTAALDG